MAKPVKTLITSIEVADVVNPTFANQPHSDLESNIDDILSYLDTTTSGFFEQDLSTTTGLNFGYRAGTVRQSNNVFDISASAAVLTDNNTNYIEIDDQSNTIVSNITAFTGRNTPLWEVVTLTGAITTVTDRRTSVHLYGGNIYINDNQSVVFGNSGVFSMYHTGTNSFIENNANILYIKSTFTSGTISMETADSLDAQKSCIIVGGAIPYVRLYEGGNEKFKTISDGVQLSVNANYLRGTTTLAGSSRLIGMNASDQVLIGGIDTTATGDVIFYRANVEQISLTAADIVMQRNVLLGDNIILNLGTGDDLTLFHNSTNSYIQNTTGILYVDQFVDGGSIVFRVDKAVDTIQDCIVIGGNTPYVRLYEDGNERLRTASHGVSIRSGGVGIAATSELRFVDTANLNLGGLGYSAGGNSDFYFKSSQTGYYRFQNETLIEILTLANTGSLTLQTGNLHILDNNFVYVGTGNDLSIYHDGTDSYIDNNTGDLIVRSLGTGTVYINAEVDGATGYLRANASNQNCIAWGGSTASPYVRLYYDSNQVAQTITNGFEIRSPASGVANLARLDFRDSLGTVQATLGFLSAINSEFSYKSTATGIHNWLNSTGTTRMRLNDIGDLYLNVGDLNLVDNASINLGTGDDLAIYHSGTNSHITHSNVGGLYISQAVDNGYIYLRTDKTGTPDNIGVVVGGATPSVRLYSDGIEVFETRTAGFNIGGDDQFYIEAQSATSTLVNFDTSDYLQFNRTSNTYNFYVGGGSRATVSTSGISTSTVTASGSLIGGGVTVNNLAANGSRLIINATDGSVDEKRYDLMSQNDAFSIRLYNDAVTTSNNALLIARTGITIDTLTLKSNIHSLQDSDGNEHLNIDSTGAIQYGGDTMYSSSIAGVTYIRAQTGRAFSLGANGTNGYLEIATDGQVAVSGGSGNPLHLVGDTGDSTTNLSYMSFMESDGITRQGYMGMTSNTDTSLYIHNDVASGLVRIATENSVASPHTVATFGGANTAASLYYNDVKKFETTSAGITVTGTITENGSLLSTAYKKVYSGCVGITNFTQSIPTATWTHIIFNDELIDVDGWHSPTLNAASFFVPTGDGITAVRISSVITVQPINTVGSIIISIHKNGVEVNQYTRIYHDPVGAGVVSLSLSDVVLPCADTDYFGIYVYHSQGSNISVVNTGGNYFNIEAVRFN